MYCLPGTRPGRQSFYFFSAQAVNSARLILLLSTFGFPRSVAEHSESLGEAKNRNRKLSPFNGRLNSRTFGRILSAPTVAAAEPPTGRHTRRLRVPCAKFLALWLFTDWEQPRGFFQSRELRYTDKSCKAVSRSLELQALRRFHSSSCWAVKGVLASVSTSSGVM